MDNSRVLVKTQMAKDAILKCDFSLSPEMRRVLIVVDGQRTIEQVMALLPSLENLGLLIEDLEALGFIEDIKGAGGVDQTHLIRPTNRETLTSMADSGDKRPDYQQPQAPEKANLVRQQAIAGDQADLFATIDSLKHYMLRVLSEEYRLVAAKIDVCDSYDRLASVLRGCETIIGTYYGKSETKAFRQRFDAYF